MLIGNLTRDPELRYTPSGTAVCSFGLATNRAWTTEGGEKKEETEFHRIVSWNKLAELCSQLLTKGRKVFVEGRLQTRTWQGQDGAQRTTTEIVIDDMIILDSRRDTAGVAQGAPVPPPPSTQASTPAAAPSDTAAPQGVQATTTTAPPPEPAVEESTPEQSGEKESEEINPDDIPF